MACAAAAVSAVGCYVLQPFWTWFPLRLVFHFSVTVLFLLSEFWIGSVSLPRRRGLILGIYATVLALCFAFSPFLFSLVGSRGFLPFALGAGMILLSAVPLLFARQSDSGASRCRSRLAS